MHLSVGQAALFLGVAISTLRRWDLAGILIPAYRTPGGHRRYFLTDLQIFTGAETPASEKKTSIAYARVSGADQRGDLDRQIRRLTQFCSENLGKFDVISDLGSGLKYDKRGLQRLIRLICCGQVQTLVLTHRDRLLRFGSQLIFTLCENFGTKVVILDEVAPATFEEELSRDVIELVTVFSARLYGKRSHQLRQKAA